MADWNLPTITSGYINFVSEMNAKFVDAATLTGSGINLPENTIRYNRSTNLFQEWVAGNWVDKVLSIAGGGTGSTTASGIRTNLGLGSMATQNSNAVNITGGSITGISFDIGSVTTGVLALARGGTGSSLALGAYGTVLMNGGGGVVSFASGINITELNAGALTTGTVPAARLSGVPTLAGVNVFTGNNYFDSGNVNIRSNSGVSLWQIQPDANVGLKNLRIVTAGGTWFFQRLTDDFVSIVNTFYISSNSGEVYGNAGQMFNINASALAFGTVAPARLGSGTANSGTFLRGDGTWQSVTTGGGGETIPSGMIAIFTTACPAGWSRFTGLDSRFPLGSTGAGSTGGSSDHSHTFDVTTSSEGSHDHSFGGSFAGSGSGGGEGNFGGTTGGPSNGSGVDAGNSFGASQDGHTHGYNVHVDLDVTVNTTTNISGNTGSAGSHNHRASGGTSNAGHTPPYYTVVYCMKN